MAAPLLSLLWLSSLLFLPQGTAGEEIAAWQRLLEPYRKVESLSCEIKRLSPLPGGGSFNMLSRVYFERGDRMHVETLTPIARRIVCDGESFRSHIETMPRGYGVAVAALPPPMLANLRALPGSPELELRQLEAAAEVSLPAGNNFVERFGYDNGKSFTVLSIDKLGRLALLEIYDSPAMHELRAKTEYGAYREILPDVWFAHRQKTSAMLRGKMRTSTLRITYLAANETLPPGLFEPGAYFKEIEFGDTPDQAVP